MPSLFHAIDQHFTNSALPPGDVTVRGLALLFPPPVPDSVRSLLAKMAEGTPPPSDPRGHPLYHRSVPEAQDVTQFDSDGTYINLSAAVAPSYPPTFVPLDVYNGFFVKRAAAAVSASVGKPETVKYYPANINTDEKEALLGFTEYGSLSEANLEIIVVPKAKCLAAMAYHDYFPATGTQFLRRMVARSILQSKPGYCGTFGPGVDAATDVADDPAEGNYDLSQMHLVTIAYRYYDELPDDARELLIVELLGQGLIHRPRVEDTVISGGLPTDWSRAGFISPLGIFIEIGETENHILVMLTVRYLANQLLYQRDRNPVHDNRRNGGEHAPHCTELVLALLRRVLNDDFSEYNAKPYQHETRTALLNLVSYAYDHEVRLAARMVLDYISAHVAVSSNDLRRMVPFRRRNEAMFGRNAVIGGGLNGFMDVGLVEWFRGADPMVEHYAMQTGQTRAFEFTGEGRPQPWSIASGGDDGVSEVESDYRVPPLIHDLFVHDSSRRFHQRLHRFIIDDETDIGGNRNTDNLEIYAGSPSYLISAGGSAATFAVPLGASAILEKVREKNAVQMGVAVTTSFIPTGRSAGPAVSNDSARDCIQFGWFSARVGEAFNYGVAPDFACGHVVHLPSWVVPDETIGFWRFVDRGSSRAGAVGSAGFYLAIYDNGVGACLEAYDTWLHPDVTFPQFTDHVIRDNANFAIGNNVPITYVTYNGSRITLTVNHVVPLPLEAFGFEARIDGIVYGSDDPQDAAGNAGNVDGQFLNGTVLNRLGEAVVEITNVALGKALTLDMSDPSHPRRVSEDGLTEVAGNNNEVWVDFATGDAQEGDFFRPFGTIAAAVAAVADFGTIKIVPGSTSEMPVLGGKKCTLVAPIGGVTFGVRA